MTKVTMQSHDGFTLFITSTGEDELLITSRIENEQYQPTDITQAVYQKISEILNQSDLQIVHERIFGSNSLYVEIMQKRKDVLRKNGVPEELPVTYIQGQPVWGEGLAGVQIRAIRSNNAKDKVWTIYDQDVPCGRGWNRNGATFLMLHNIHGLNKDQAGENAREDQASRMFDWANRVLEKQGAGFQNVVRTWIYLSDILDWYKEFNIARNKQFHNFHLLGDSEENFETEKIYLPASTGIEGDNPLGAAGVMDVLAVLPKKSNSLQIQPQSGVKQKSPYRYGSAFSRSISIKEKDLTYIMLSGTAAIDDHGKSLYPGDARAQIKKTIDVVEALIAKEGGKLRDICEATAFLKRAEDIPIYNEVISEYGLESMPAICVVADICRDELLFELDAMVSFFNSSANE